MTQSPFKVCPQCQTPAALDAPSCTRCGRQYRTQFVPPQQQTHVFAGNPSVPVRLPVANPAKKRIIFLLVAVCLVPVLCFAAWRASAPYRGEPVTITNPSGFSYGSPMATRDPEDLSVWNRRASDSSGQTQMEDDGRIVYLARYVTARLLRAENGLAHIYVTSGKYAGTEGYVWKGILNKYDTDIETPPSSQGSDLPRGFNGESFPGSGG